MMATIFTGVLRFATMDRSWCVHENGIDFDTCDGFWSVAEALKDKECSMECKRDYFSLDLDISSTRTLYLNRETHNVVIGDDRSFSNAGYYLETTLQALNGRKVIAKFSSFGFRIEAAPDDDAPAVKFFDGNSSRIPAGMEQAICKVGQGKECCIFMTMTAKGYVCEKFNPPTARYLLNRLAKGEMNAGRIGNCKNIGRE